MTSQCQGNVGFVGIQMTFSFTVVGFLQLSVGEREDIREHSPQVGILKNWRMILQTRINGRDDKTSHFRLHSMLHAQHARLHSVFDGTFEKGDVQEIIFGQAINCRWGLQLLVITWTQN